LTVGRSSSPTHQAGAAAEDAAMHFLQQQGFQLLAQNYHTPYGELDIVVRQQQLLVFAEVRLRKAGALVSAQQSVTPRKQQKIIQSAQYFLQQFPAYQDCDCRFDVMALQPQAAPALNAYPGYQVDWVQAAFYAE
jgi:putative endonuclease